MLSIIIPTYNETENIGSLISYLKKASLGNEVEIIVCDGGSNDETIYHAREAGATVILSPTKGRAAQMNFGASIAKGNIFYFIHADTLPPECFVADIEMAVNQGYDLGRYRTKFAGNKNILKMNAFFTRFDLLVCYGGDQTLFIKKKLFTQINGFNNDMLIMEDYDIVKRARVLGKYKIFKKSALVSARKYETNSWLKVQKANKIVVSMYNNGSSQQAMINKYQELLNYR
jgi:rSAM/selenodomain-associated transferase 2